MVCGYVAIIPIAHPNAQILAASDERDTERKQHEKTHTDLKSILAYARILRVETDTKPVEGIRDRIRDQRFGGIDHLGGIDGFRRIDVR